MERPDGDTVRKETNEKSIKANNYNMRKSGIYGDETSCGESAIMVLLFV